MRSFLDQEFVSLDKELLYMGAKVERSIESAVLAFCNKDINKANETIALESEIENMGKHIESLCVNLLLRFQPVASDLHRLSALLRMINDIERIGVQASEIASLVIHLCNTDDGYILSSLVHMASDASEMVKKSLVSYIKQDIELAHNVIADDDKVDEHFVSIRSDIINMIIKRPEMAEAEIDLMMICKYLEKIGDHATSIARWVIYSITGEKEDK